MKSKQRWYRRHQLFNQSIHPSLSSWLFDSSSLTARLIGLCGENFSVRVISQRYQKLDSTEASAMDLQNVRAALVRQVLLCCKNQPLVYARTVIPVTTIQGAQRRYANMGNRPLGAMLFSDRTMQREAVEVAMLPFDDDVNRYTDSNEPIWGRRSVFRVSGRPLLVSEYFLPELLMRS
ncbi:MAG: chorismate lyase [Gammaproteobacteria bacterium]|nr:chorismate lyase [Gammaproteobacteria bacterium]